VPLAASAPDLDLPALLGGRYRVTRRIGQGSIAQVVAAHDEVSGGEVALKILYRNLRSNQVVADRFRREVQVVRRIRHPHVVRIDDLIDDQGLLFLVMELHPGGDLADRLAAGGRLPAPALLLLARQICGALAAAHRAGVVHRDVKPQNILVGADPAALDVRLCDFGLARTADLAGLTTGATVLGTPEYMAPEVISDGYADPRSDLYSLGVVLYEAVTGRLPFRGDSPYQLLRQHLTAPPPRPRALVPDLPPEIDEAITRALSKEPLDRFAGAADLEAALAGAASAPGSAAPVPRAVCRHCGGALVELVRTCVDCGQRSLHVRTQKRGWAVLVSGPGEPAEKIDGRSHVELVKLLEELPPGTTGLDGLREKPPRVPFYVAANLDRASADDLVARLEELGFAASVKDGPSLRPQEMRAKVWRMGKRYLALSLGFGWAASHAWLAGVPELGLLVAVALTAPMAAPLFLFRRPLVRIQDPGGGDATEERLASTLATLNRRADRRLVARILDRLRLAGRLGAGAGLTALTERAALAAEGLVKVDGAARDADEAELQRAIAAGRAGDDAAAALDRLREGERLRGVLVADLLRTFSRLDLLCLKLARAEGLRGQARMQALAAEVDDIRAQLAAEDDLAGLLGT
jgi:tRNA A-37 threonylcarbamoyl transferase component Bud32